MTRIDGIKSLNPELMQAFLEGLDDSTIVGVLTADYATEISISKVKEWSFLDEQTELSDDDEIRIVAKDKYLVIAGIDYKWWNTARRKKKLFNVSTEKKELPKTTFFIEAATLTENGLTDVKQFSGKKREIVDFMNYELSDRLMKTFNEGLVVFRLEDSTQWLTIEELEEKGLVTLR